MAHRAPPSRQRPNWLLYFSLVLASIAALILVVVFWPARQPVADSLPLAVVPSHGYATPPPTAVAPSPAPSLIAVRVTATAPCWVQLTQAGGTTVYVGTILPGVTESWSIQPPGSLRLGYPAGVSVTVNGQPVTTGPGGPTTIPITQGN